MIWSNLSGHIKAKLALTQMQKQIKTLKIKLNFMNLKLNNRWHESNGNTVDDDKPRHLKGNALKHYKTTLALNQNQRELLIGLLLGDGYFGFARASKNPSYKLIFAQALKRADYVDHVYQEFKPFVGMPPKINLIGGIKLLLACRPK